MQVVSDNQVPMALWQPIYVVCIGAQQVRVVTVAFVGEPVAGDRPDSKRTPYILRLITNDLVSVPNCEDPALAASTVHYECQHASAEAECALEYFVLQEPQLLAAMQKGDWSDFGIVEPPQRVQKRKV